jgi:GNAT superfamily N-acetyltransferase
MAPTLRRARVDDLPQLMALYALLDTGGEPAPDEAAARTRFEALTARDEHRIHVAERDGGVVGTYALVFVGGLPHTARDSAIVEDVVVAAHCQGQGIGRLMMDHAMAQCVERGCYKLVLSSHLMRAAAHRFYEGLGFRRHGYSFLIGGEAAVVRPP